MRSEDLKMPKSVNRLLNYSRVVSNDCSHVCKLRIPLLRESADVTTVVGNYSGVIEESVYRFGHFEILGSHFGCKPWFAARFNMLTLQNLNECYNLIGY